MRILYLTRGWTVHDRRFVGSLLEAGHQVALRAVEQIPAAAVKSMQVDERLSVGDWGAVGAAFWVRLPWIVRDLRRLADDFHPDVVHAGPIQRGSLAAVLAGLRPLVSMSWGSDLLRDASAGPGRWWASFVLRRSDSFACDSETVRARSIELGMDPTRISVFPWGVDLAAFAPAGGSRIRRVLGWEAAFVLLAARPWEPSYGTRLVAEAFAIAASREPDLRLLLLGDGRDRNRIRKRLESTGTIGRVHLAGPIDHADLPDYFRAADLYVSASRSDGSSVTLLEAMASGLPAAVPDLPSNREWIDNSNGWTFRDGDSDSLAESILRAGRDRRQLHEMGLAARRVAEARADWNKNFPRLSQAYQMAQEWWARRANGR